MKTNYKLKWDHVLNSIRDSVILLDMNGIIEECNAVFLKMLNKPSSEVIGASCYKIINDEDGDPEDCPFFKAKISKKRETSNIIRNGRWFKVDVDPIIDENNEITGFVQFMSDITQWKKAEDALSESEKQYRTLFNNMLYGFALHKIVLDKNNVPIDYTFVEINDAFEEQTGLKREKIIGKRVTEVIPEIENDPTGWIELYGKVALSGNGARFESFSAPLNKWYSIITYGPKKGYFATIFEDITARKQVEDSLKAQNIKYQTLLLNLNGMVYYCENDKNWTMKFISAGCLKLTGYKPEDLINNNKLSYNDIILPEYQDYLWEQWQNKLKCFDPVEVEYEIKTASGEFKWVWERGRGIFDDNGTLLRLEGFITDITDRKLAEIALLESEEKFRTLTENINVGIYRNTVGAKGKFIEANPAIVKMFGFKNRKEFLSHSVSELYLHPEQRNKFNDEMLNKGFVKNEEIHLKKKDGSIFYGSISAVTIHDKDGKVLFYDGMINDITERKLAERALLESEKKYRELFEKSKDAILIINNGKFVDCNQAAVKLLRYNDKNDCLNVHPSELSPEKQPDGAMSFSKANEMIKIALDNGSHRFEWDHVRSDGEIFPTEVLLTAIPGNEQNQVIHTVWRDITERKKSEIALRESEERFKQLVENANDIIYRLDANGHVVYVNPVTLKLGNYTKKDLIGINYLDIVHPDYYHEAKRFFRNQLIKKTKNTYKELPIKTKNGSYVWLGQNVQLLFEKDKIVGFQAVARDITEQKKSDLALQENEKRYRYLFNQSPTSIWEEDFSEVYKYITSLKKKGIKDFREYFENHLDEVKKCSKMVQIIDINEITIKLFGAKNKKDMITNLGSIFTEESLSSFTEQLCSIAENHTRYTGEIINRTLDGKLLNVIIKLNVVPGYEKDYSRVLISLMDITKLKKAEEELRNGRERLKMLNKIIRHDIANDFIVIKSAINIFRRSSDEKMIDEIEKRVNKSLTTIDSYRKYESFIDLNQDLEEFEITESLNDIIAEFPNIEFNIHGKCKVFADNALDSVFTNLISNSIKHGNSTKIDIKISSEQNICKIKFMDNGTGIPDKIKNQIFDEGFFHGQTGNTGIGLHIVKKTIERYEGSIFVEDNEPGGAVFLITLKKAL